MLQSGGLAPTAMSSRVRLSRGKLTTIDGPFAETKEVGGGFAVFEFKSREEAIESAVNFMELHKQHWHQLTQAGAPVLAEIPIRVARLGSHAKAADRMRVPIHLPGFRGSRAMLLTDVCVRSAIRPPGSRTEANHEGSFPSLSGVVRLLGHLRWQNRHQPPLRYPGGSRSLLPELANQKSRYSGSACPFPRAFRQRNAIVRRPTSLPQRWVTATRPVRNFCQKTER
jgi:hypothetical protein